MMIFTIAKTIFSSMLRKPVTIRYPFVQRQYPAQARGSIAIEQEKCIFCGICQKKCPTSAIIVDRDAKTWNIDRLKCIVCAACVESCPKKCLSMSNQYTAPQGAHLRNTD